MPISSLLQKDKKKVKEKEGKVKGEKRKQQVKKI